MNTNPQIPINRASDQNEFTVQNITQEMFDRRYPELSYKAKMVTPGNKMICFQPSISMSELETENQPKPQLLSQKDSSDQNITQELIEETRRKLAYRARMNTPGNKTIRFQPPVSMSEIMAEIHRKQRLLAEKESSHGKITQDMIDETRRKLSYKARMNTPGNKAIRFQPPISMSEIIAEIHRKQRLLAKKNSQYVSMYDDDETEDDDTDCYDSDGDETDDDEADGVETYESEEEPSWKKPKTA